MTGTDIPTLDVQSRSDLGTRPTQRLRDAGLIPAVLYGHKAEPLHLATDPNVLAKMLEHHAHVIELKLDDGNSVGCLIKAVQWNHLGTQIVHVDFLRVDMTERITVTVGLELVGEPAALKESGSVLEQQLSELEVECMATMVPEMIQVDISNMGAGESLSVSDITLPEGMTSTVDGEMLVASITQVKDEPEDDAEAEAAGDEPEVITKKPEEKGDEG